MAKGLTTAKGALARATLDECDDDARAHQLRAANFKFERRHDIQAAAFEAQSKAREDYLAEVAEINGAEDYAAQCASEWIDRQAPVENISHPEGGEGIFGDGGCRGTARHTYAGFGQHHGCQGGGKMA